MRESSVGGTGRQDDVRAPDAPVTPNARHRNLHEADAHLLDQLFEGIDGLDRAHGRAFDSRSKRMGWSLLALAKEHGLRRADHVVVSVAAPGVAAGENVFVVQGGLDDPAHRLAHMKTAEVIGQPVDASLARIGEVAARQAEPSIDGAMRSAPLHDEPSAQHRMA